MNKEPIGPKISGLFVLALSAACLASLAVPEAFTGIEAAREAKWEVKTIVARRVDQGPMLDGLPIDSCWIGVPGVRISSPPGGEAADMMVKACNDGVRIYFLIQHETGTPRRKHRPWHWDPLLQAYVPGEEREEAFSIVLTAVGDPVADADIWVWRAARTDPVSKADDMYYHSSMQFGREVEGIGFDSGMASWFSKYFGSFSGMSLPRFFNRSPAGSMADVDAKGSWDKHILSIEFGRKLITGNGDDIALGTGEFRMLLHPGTPCPQKICEGVYARLLVE